MTKVKLRALNESGIGHFYDYLTVLRTDPRRPPPFDLLETTSSTIQIGSSPDIRFPKCNTKYEVAQYLNEVLRPVNGHTLRTNHGLWAWLALCGFDLLCPAAADGRRKSLDTVKYVPQPGDHRFGLDKHLLFFPWKLFTIHGRDAAFLLSTAPHQEAREQREWTGYYQNVCRSALQLCKRLYWDEDQARLRRGAKSSNPGALRDYVRMIKFLDETYDLNGIGADRLVTLLPPRFKRFMRSMN